jgi:hypothetical protein
MIFVAHSVVRGGSQTAFVVLDWPCHSGWGPAAAILRFKARALTLVRLVQARGGAGIYDRYAQHTPTSTFLGDHCHHRRAGT